MAYSSECKQALVSWFYNHADFGSTNMQLHKFIFFMSVFRKLTVMRMSLTP